MSNYDEQNNEIELNEQDLEQVAGASGGCGYYQPYYPHFYQETYHHESVKYEFEQTDINIIQY